MDWARILAYVTGTVDQELLARNEYLAAENRILKSQLNGRLRLLARQSRWESVLPHGGMFPKGAIPSRLSRYRSSWTPSEPCSGRSVIAWAAKPLPRSRLSRGRTPSLPGTASLSPVSSMAQKLVEVRADRGSPERSEERRVGKEGRSRWSPYH